MTRTAHYLAGHAVGIVPDTTCRVNPYDLATEEGLDWYAGWYTGNDETGYWKSLAKLENEELAYLVARIYAHSCLYYSNGWDIVMESMETAEIAAHLTAGMTVTEAINAVAEAEYLEVYNDARNDALGAGGLPTTKFIKGA